MLVSRLRRVTVMAISLGLCIAGIGQAVAADPSNKGGADRGVTRADDRAGVNGDKGRDRAEASKAKAKKDTGKGHRATAASK
jgi:hypothetical protein